MKKITKKMVVGISGIVLFLSIVIGFVFLTQYRSILLEERKKDMELKASQIATILTKPINENNILQSREGLDVLSTVTDTNMWIVSIENNSLISNTNINDVEKAKNRVEKDIQKIIDSKDKNIVSYEYSDFFKEKQMTLITRVYSNNKLVGILFLHKDIDDINVKYDSLVEMVSATITIGTLISMFIAVIFSYMFTNPIDKMKIIAKDISCGNYGIKTNIVQDDELGELANALDNMSVELEKYITDIRRLESSAKELVANVSHEFKTPLTLIRGYVENLQDGTLEPNDEIYNKIIRNTKLLESLVNEILDLNKYQTGKVFLKKELLDLNGVVIDTVNDMQSIAKNKGIELELINENRDPIPLEIDYLKLKQLLTIFVDNAIKYSPKNSKVEVIMSNRTIQIKDMGIGMSEEQVSHIYERFYQADTQKQGNGLGMCIAKYIIDLHKFKVNIESEINKGTTIILKV